MSFAHVTKKSSLKSLYLPCNCHVISSGQSPLTTTLPHCNPHPLLSATLTISSLQPSPFPPCNPHRFLPATFTPSSLQLSLHPLQLSLYALCNSHFIPLHYIYLSNTSFASLLYTSTLHISVQHFFCLSPARRPDRTTSAYQGPLPCQIGKPWRYRARRQGQTRHSPIETEIYWP
jgi:hypothetical protein